MGSPIQLELRSIFKKKEKKFSNDYSHNGIDQARNTLNTHVCIFRENKKLDTTRALSHIRA
jgi:hypothetical protein